MKRGSPGSINRPFADLDQRLARRRKESPARPAASAVARPRPRSLPPPAPMEPEEEARLFARWMKGVTLIAADDRTTAPPARPDRGRPGPDPEEEAQARLAGVVERGEGFVVSQTGEYVEGAGYGVHPNVPRRLHRGVFSIQGHIDLHGLTGDESEIAMDEFLQYSITARKRAVVIIHGRGLSSPGEPVLKARVVESLTRGPWRKWVIAFCSARAVDGGTGATYVLLRDRPITHGAKKRAGR